jgi:hypothetical protein
MANCLPSVSTPLTLRFSDLPTPKWLPDDEVADARIEDLGELGGGVRGEDAAADHGTLARRLVALAVGLGAEDGVFNDTSTAGRAVVVPDASLPVVEDAREVGSARVDDGSGAEGCGFRIKGESVGDGVRVGLF